MIPTRAIQRSAPKAGHAVGIGAPGGPLPLGPLGRSRAVRSFKDARALVGALRKGEISAAVRGALAPSDALAAVGPAARLSRAVLLQPAPGSGVLFGPVGVTEGRGATARARFARLAAQALKDHALVTEDPLVAVLSFGREEDAPRGAHVARSLNESARVVGILSAEGLDAFHAGAQVEDVLRDADIVVAPDGASGNLAFRALHLAAGMRSYGAITLGTPLRFVDTSRRRASYEDPVRFAAYLAQSAARD